MHLKDFPSVIFCHVVLHKTVLVKILYQLRIDDYAFACNLNLCFRNSRLESE